MDRRARIYALLPVLGLLAGVLALLGPTPTADAADPVGTINAVAGTFQASGTSLGTPMQPDSVAVLGTNLLISDGAHSVAWSATTTGSISTIIGNGLSGQGANDVVATSAQLVGPGGIDAAAGIGTVISDAGGWRIHFVAATTCAASCPYGLASTTAGNTYRIAGTGTSGDGGDTGAATSANIDTSTESLAVDAAGNVFFADETRHIVRMVAATTCAGPICAGGLAATTAGFIYKIAGISDLSGSSADGVTATGATLNGARGVAVDSVGNVLIADTNDNKIRMISGVANCAASCAYGLAATTFGALYTIAGTGAATSTGDGAAATSATLNGPRGLDVDATGNVLIAETSGNRIRMYANGTCAGGCYGASGTTQHFMYTVVGTGAPGNTGDGGAATSATISGPVDVVADSANRLIIADRGNFSVRVVPSASCTSCYGAATTNAGAIRTIAGNNNVSFLGDGGSATAAQFASPQQSALDTSGNLFITDTRDNRIRMVAATTCSSSCAFGIAPTTAGSVYTVAGNSGLIETTTDDVAATSTNLWGPSGVAVDASGNLVVAEESRHRVRLVARTTCSSSCAYGLASTVIGRIYTIAGNGTSTSTGDGAVATSSTVNGPTALIIDGVGNVLFLEKGGHRIRMIAAATCASSCRYGLASTVANRIYTIAGTGTGTFGGDNGVAASATLNLSNGGGLGVDSAGNLFVAEASSHRVRMVAAATCGASCPFGLTTTAGNIRTIAGDGDDADSGDGGPATGLDVGRPHSATVDPAGNVLISQWFGLRVRLVARAACASSCPYNLGAMTAGSIYRIAGDGNSGAGGNGGAATSATLGAPHGIVINRTGDAILTDSGNHRIRRIQNQPVADLTVRSTHTDPFVQSGTGSYTLTVTNNGTGTTVGTVQVVDTLPAGLTPTAISGTGWACVLGTLTCTRSDALGEAASYPAITVTATVAANATGPVSNSAAVSGGGQLALALATADDTSTDATTFGAAPTTTTTVGGGDGGGGAPATSSTTSTTLAAGDPTVPDGVEDVEIGRSDDPDGEIEIDSGDATVLAEGEASVLVGVYDENPEDETPPGAPDDEGATFFDVKVGAASSFRSVTVTQCNVPPSTTLWWHDGTRWRMVTPQSSSGGCVSTTLDGGSSPRPSDLTGTPFAVATSPIQRVAGVDRLATAVASSEWAFVEEGSAAAAVLARSDGFADALAGVPLAARVGGPLLLTPTDVLAPATAAELQRVLPAGATVHLLGGEAALSPAVEDAVRGAGFQPVRIGGVDRYATAVAIAAALGDPDTLLVASGTTFADALAAGPAASAVGGAILLTDGSAQSPSTAAYVAAHGAARRYAIGGPAAAADGGATAVVGADRYATAAAVAALFFDNPTTVGAATGTAFPDALAAGAALDGSGPLLLVPSSGASSALDEYLGTVAAGLRQLVVFGGTSAVSPEAEDVLLGSFV